MHAPSRQARSVSVSPELGKLLRQWRSARGMSQLRLALEAGISARHLSFIETGKAQPSREMISRLSDAFGLPLREQNLLLIAAGYAPRYRETALTMPEMGPCRHAIDSILAQQEPFPAIVLNRSWDILKTNKAMERIAGWLGLAQIPHPNMARLIFDSEGLRPYIANWDALARQLLQHLNAAAELSPFDTRIGALLAEIKGAGEVPRLFQSGDAIAPASPVLATVLRKGGLTITFFSVITTFASPRDLTLDDIRIECLFPADDRTARFCRRLAAEKCAG